MQSTSLRLLQINKTKDDITLSYGTESSEDQPEPIEPNEEQKSKWNHFIGIFLAFMMGLLFTLMSLVIKYLKNKNSIDVAFMYCVGTCIFAFPFFINCRKTGVDRKFFPLIVLLGGVLSLTQYTRFTALKMLPIGEASAIVFNVPIFTAIFARIILKDSISRVTLFSLLVSFIGMMLVAKVPELIRNAADNHSSRNTNSIGYVYAFSAVISMSLIVIICRKLRYVNSWVITFCHCLVATIMLSALSPALSGLSFGGECSYQSWLFLGIGVYGLVASTLFNFSVKYEDPVIVSSIILTTDIISSFLIQVFFFNDPIDAFTYAGASLLFVSGMLLPFRKWVLSLPNQSPIRQKLHWMEK